MNNDLMFTSNHCLQCEKVLNGRTDKKFCDSYCRNSYNNQHKSTEEAYMQEINRHIRKNRRILKTLCPEGKATVRREVLEKLGYNFNCFSSMFSTRSMVYYLSYDYGFAPIIERDTIQKVIIVKQQLYMEEKNFDPWTTLKD